MNFAHYARLTLNRVEPSNLAQRRYQRIAQSALTAVGSKGILFLVGFLSVPLTVNYLGAERYGVWMIISSLLIWLQMADLGLGNGLINAIAEAYGKEQKNLAARYFSTTFWLLVGIVFLLGTILGPLWWFLDWATIFNVKSDLARSEISGVIGVSFLITLFGIPLSVVEKALVGYQENAANNFWTTLANLASLIGIVLTTRYSGGLIVLAGSFFGLAHVVRLISAIWLLVKHKPWLSISPMMFDQSASRKLLGTGGLFFVIQLAVLVNMQTDNLVIGHYLGADKVTSYSVTWRLFLYIAIIPQLVLPALWPAFSEAFIRRDANWIKRTLKVTLVGNISLTIITSILLIFFGQDLILLWAGKEAVPSFSILAWMAIWSVINTAMSTLAICVLNSSGNLKLQATLGVLAAVVNLALTIYLVVPFGSAGVIAGTVISYTFIVCIPATIQSIAIVRQIQGPIAR